MTRIPVLLLKTRSTPPDAYEEHLESLTSTNTSDIGKDFSNIPDSLFSPIFVPVLEHRANDDSLRTIQSLLREGTLGERYGGMIFTSQRAVEALTKAVEDLAKDTEVVKLNSESRGLDADELFPVRPDIFSLYAVGPATARSLTTLLTSNPSRLPTSLSSLNPVIVGSHTGNGSALAQYILYHYNALHAETLYTFYEAPRLPFIPLLGGGAEQYVRRGRRRIESDDPRLQKKPLLFLAGEVRRDIIPKVLRRGELVEESPRLRPQRPPDTTANSKRDSAIAVDELEIYSTILRPSFASDLSSMLPKYQNTSPTAHRPTVVVLFSPTGSDIVVEALNLPNDDTILATIGPTTRDHLRSKHGIEADLCAAEPTPEALGRGIVDYLREKGSI